MAYFADHAIAIFVEMETQEGEGEALFLLFRDDYNFGTAELDPSQFQRRRRLQHGVFKVSQGGLSMLFLQKYPCTQDKICYKYV